MDKIVYIGVGLLIILIGIYLAFPIPEAQPEMCVLDEDCILFGETGDCNCGCYLQSEVPTEAGGECFCQAPTSCECIDGKCEGIFLSISSFEECSKHYPVMESYPEQCSTGDRTFTRNIIDPYNTEYIIEEQSILLEDGYSEMEQAPGSASKLITQMLGEPVYGDVNNDGIDDIVLVLTQQGGGSGTFFYLALITDETQTKLAGDRIIVQDITMGDNFVEMMALDRELNEPMTAEPSVPKIVRIEL